MWKRLNPKKVSPYILQLRYIIWGYNNDIIIEDEYTTSFKHNSYINFVWKVIVGIFSRHLRKWRCDNFWKLMLLPILPCKQRSFHHVLYTFCTLLPRRYYIFSNWIYFRFKLLGHGRSCLLQSYTLQKIDRDNWVLLR